MTKKAGRHLIAVAVLAVFLLAGISGRALAEVKSDRTVEEGNTVKLHYVLTVEGKEVDSSRQRGPFEFVVGSGKVIEGFDRAVRGMKVGETKSFTVQPEEGYGPADPEAVQEVPVSALPQGVTPEKGMTLYGKDPEGKVVPATIKEVKEDTIVVDFNHPMAGKTLNFEIELLGIE